MFILGVSSDVAWSNGQVGDSCGRRGPAADLATPLGVRVGCALSDGPIFGRCSARTTQAELAVDWR